MAVVTAMQASDFRDRFTTGLGISCPERGLPSDLSFQLSDAFRNGRDAEAAHVLYAARDLLSHALEVKPAALEIFGNLPRDPSVASSVETALARFLGAVRGPDALRELCAQFRNHMYHPERFTESQLSESPFKTTIEYLRAFAEFKGEAACASGMITLYLNQLTHPSNPAAPPHTEEPRLFAETIKTLNAVGLTDRGRALLQGLAIHSQYQHFGDIIAEALWTSSKAKHVEMSAFKSDFSRQATRVFSRYNEAVAATALEQHAENVLTIRRTVRSLKSIATSLEMMTSAPIAIDILATLKSDRITAFEGLA